MARVLTAVGLMSGTSMDGVDTALIETDGEGVVRRGPGLARPYTARERGLIEAAVDEARGLNDRHARPQALEAAETMLTRAHAEAVEALIAENAIDRGRIEVVGLHGQTVLHRPQARLTLQLGDGPLLAELLGCEVVYDFRAADVAAGGQGAPFVPAYHRALVQADQLGLPVAVVNIGGVGNVTYIGAQDFLAFDTGPGNGLMDDWAHKHTGQAVDLNGALAAKGRVNEAALERLLAHPFFDLPPPKSLDRSDFTLDAVMGLGAEEGAATLAAFTAETLARAVRHVPAAPKLWVISGGGARNPTLMRELAQRLPGEVTTADALGWSAEFMEAQAFAYLAVRSLRGLPLSYPGTTGVPNPQTGGVRVCPPTAPAARAGG